MGFRVSILILLVLFNVFPLLALYRAANTWIRSESRRKKVLIAAGTAIFLLNIPIGLFFFRSLYHQLYGLPSPVLRIIFYPALAWQTTAVVLTLLLGPAYVIWAAARLARRLSYSEGASARKLRPVGGAPAISRRGFLTGGAGLLVPATYFFSAYQLHRSPEEVEVSPELAIPIANLPRSLDGMTIVQLSDLHVGPYARQKEVEHWVSLANALRPDLVVLTGDLIDRSLISLPDALQGLKRLRAPLGVLATLGNHDISSDRFGARGELRGGENIARAMQTIGIRTLRNQVHYVGSGAERLAIMGLDWVTTPDMRNFYRYHPAPTRNNLRRMAAEVTEETPKILLAHHPDTFAEVHPFQISLTLSGHTHGGGQVVLFTWEGAPVGISSGRFKYVSGLYREGGCSLYVNRGLGYFGIPIRINCPPEISRFRLVRQLASGHPHSAAS